MKTNTTTIQDRKVTLTTDGDCATLRIGAEFCNYARIGGDFEPTTMSNFFSAEWTEESEAEVWAQFVAKYGYSEAKEREHIPTTKDMKTTMKTNLFKQAQERLSDTNVEVRRYRSNRRFATANYLVRIKTGSPQTMSDGSFWDGFEHVGHFDTIANAVAAAYEAAGLE